MNNIQKAEKRVEAGAPALALTSAARDVLAERQRQFNDWTPEHDDQHGDGAMAAAAACYALHSAGDSAIGSGKLNRMAKANYPKLVGNLWPWGAEWWKPRESRRNLVKAGALILAEIERLDRKALHTTPLPSHDHVSTP